MRRALGPAVVALAAAATAALVWGAWPDPPAALEEKREAEALLATLGYAQPACSLCHYAWDETLLLSGTASADGRAFDALAATGGAHDVVDVRVVPVYDGTERASLVALEETTRVLVGGTEDVPVHVSAGSTILFASARPASETSRATLAIEILAPDGTVAAEGSAPGSLVQARAAPEGGLAEGDYVLRVRLEGASLPFEDVLVAYDVAGPGVLALDDLPEGAPVAWALAFDAPPRALLVAYRPWNVHPTDKWILPNFADLGLYTTLVTAGEAPAPRNWSAEAVDAGWAGEARRTLVDESVSGTTTRVRNDRGEWTSRSSWRVPPGPEQAFAALPPGTRLLDARITWAPATPFSPVPEFYFGYTLPGNPVFLYPEPVESGDGFHRYEVPVAERHWEAFDGTGAFQGFALMRVNEQGAVAFDGERRLVVDAVR